jgi:predicted RNA-binding Zn-ribbon protein involved in translation (DUF1610 family)
MSAAVSEESYCPKCGEKVILLKITVEVEAIK